MRPLFRFLLCLVFAIAPALSAQAAGKTYVYAASSLTGAVTTLCAALEGQSGQRFIPVFGASSTLARQILQGAPADLYISANALWMDKVEEAGMIEPGSRMDIAENQLVVAAPTTTAAPLELSDPNTFLKRLGKGRLAMGDPAHVPAGIYGKQALTRLGLWDAVQNRLAAAANVRLALTFIERGETPLGIVYASDLVGRADARAVAVFPAESHSPIRYPLATIRGKSSPEAIAFRRFLQSADGRAILTRYGFQPL